MLNKLIILIISILLGSCSNPRDKPINPRVRSGNTDTIRIQENFSIQQLKQQLIDSLPYFFYDSLKVIKRNDNPDYVLYTGSINNQKLGVVAITDSILFLFQQIQGKWTQTDSAVFHTYAFAFGVQDLNGDKKDDFIVYSFPNMHGQSVPYVFLCNTAGILHHRSDIRLYNMQYDSKLKLVRSYYQGGVNSLNYKELYRWEGDSLRLVKGVETNLSVSDKKIPETAFYMQKNGKKVYFKRIPDNDGTIFDTAFWGDPYDIRYER